MRSGAGSRTLKGCAGLLLLGIVLLLGFCAYSEFDFRSDRKQRAQLAHYIPDAKCDSASFALIERIESFRDYRYVFRIAGSPICTQSLRSALAARGAIRGGIFATDSETTLALPGHTKPGKEVVVSFDFDAEPGNVIWTRDKT